MHAQKPADQPRGVGTFSWPPAGTTTWPLTAMPPERKTPVRTAPRLDVLKPAFDKMLREDLDAPRKQRHTGRAQTRLTRRGARRESTTAEHHRIGKLVRSQDVRERSICAPANDRHGCAISTGLRAIPSRKFKIIMKVRIEARDRRVCAALSARSAWSRRAICAPAPLPDHVPTDASLVRCASGRSGARSRGILQRLKLGDRDLPRVGVQSDARRCESSSRRRTEGCRSRVPRD